MQTLVVNLTRFGDLLQSQPAVTGLAGQGRVGLVCLENFAAAAELLDHVDEVFPLPGQAFLPASGGWRKSLGACLEWFGRVRRDFAPARVVNLTPSLSARLLGLGFEDAKRIGLTLDSFGFSNDTSPWAAFLQTASTYRGCSPFNVADLFCRVAGLTGEHPPFALAGAPEALCRKMAARLGEAAPQGAKGFLGLQLGASENRRRWPLAHFARLAETAWERLGLCPVVFGSPEEVPLAQRFERESRAPCVRLAGETDLVQLAAALPEMDCLVTNDTGTMHLAAGLGVDVCAVFLCTAQPFDTGPYREGSLCLEPDIDCHPCAFGSACDRLEACRSSIAPETVFAHLAARAAGRGWGRATGRGARAWVTVRDEAGFMDLAPLPGQEVDDRYAWVRMQRWYYRQFLDEREAVPLAEAGNSFTPAAAAELTDALRRTRDMLTLLDSQAGLLAVAPRPALKQKFLAYWQRLQALLRADPRLTVLSGLLLLGSQQCGDDLAAYAGLIRRFLLLVQAMLAPFPD